MSNKPMNMLFAIESLTIGGAERLVVDLATRIDRERFTPHVVCLAEAGALADELGDVPLYVLGKRRGPDLRMVPRLRSLVSRVSPVVVNSHLWTANTWIRFALAGRAILVPTEHNRDTWKRWYHRAIDRWLAKRSRVLVAVSSDAAGFYTREVGVSANLVRVIANGIDTARMRGGEAWRLRSELGIPESATVIGSIGRMVAQKNHMRLLEAVALVRQERQDTALLLAGSGPELPALRARAQQADLAGCVYFAGLRGDVPDVLAAMDVFALASDREGHPLTLMEAQAAGVPVVATDVGGCARALARDDRGAGGCLVRPEVRALAGGLLELVNDPKRRKRMGDFAREYARAHFDLQRMIDDYQELFCEVACHVR